MDAHNSGDNESYFNDNSGNSYENGFSSYEYGPSHGSSFEMEGSFHEGGFPGGMERRLCSSLSAKGMYSELDKAKHNPHYMQYLLENYDYDDDLPF